MSRGTIVQILALSNASDAKESNTIPLPHGIFVSDPVA
jgi:hypothetical protein